MKKAVDWMFRSRVTGRITFAQWPNLPLWIYIGAAILRVVVKPGGAHSVFGAVATVALIVWALLEIVRGVNPFRRGLGAVVLLTTVVARILN